MTLLRARGERSRKIARDVVQGSDASRRLPALHPFLLVGAFVVAEAVSEGVAPAGFIRPLLVGIGGALLIAIAVAAGARSWSVGAMAATGLFLLLLSRGPVIWLLGFARDAFGIGGGTAFLVVLGAVAVVGLIPASLAPPRR